MNVPFVTPSKEQDADVVSASKAAGFDNLKGHKSVAVCGRPSTTPCPRRAWRPWWSS